MARNVARRLEIIVPGLPPVIEPLICQLAADLNWALFEFPEKGIIRFAVQVTGVAEPVMDCGIELLEFPGENTLVRVSHDFSGVALPIARRRRLDAHYTYVVYGEIIKRFIELGLIQPPKGPFGLAPRG